MMSGMTMIFLTVMFFPPGILSQARKWSFGAVPSQERRHEEVLVWGILSLPLPRRREECAFLVLFAKFGEQITRGSGMKSD